MLKMVVRGGSGGRKGVKFTVLLLAWCAVLPLPAHEASTPSAWLRRIGGGGKALGAALHLPWGGRSEPGQERDAAFPFRDPLTQGGHPSLPILAFLLAPPSPPHSHPWDDLSPRRRCSAPSSQSQPFCHALRQAPLASSSSSSFSRQRRAHILCSHRASSESSEGTGHNSYLDSLGGKKDSGGRTEGRIGSSGGRTGGRIGSAGGRTEGRIGSAENAKDSYLGSLDRPPPPTSSTAASATTTTAAPAPTTTATPTPTTDTTTTTTPATTTTAKDATANPSGDDKAQKKSNASQPESVPSRALLAGSLPVQNVEDDEARHPIWSLFGSRVFKRIVPRLLFGCVWCSVVSCLYHFFPYFHHFKGFTHTITGTFLGLLIAFRTNEGYARYWEARNAWAQCGCMCRRLAMLLASSVNGNAQVTERVFQLLQAFPFALKQHLRGQRSEADLGKILGRQDLQSLESSNNVPARLCFMLTEATLPLLYEESRVVWMKAERQIQELSIIVGVMERLATTPVPLSYLRHTSRSL